MKIGAGYDSRKEAQVLVGLTTKRRVLHAYFSRLATICWCSFVTRTYLTFTFIISKPAFGNAKIRLGTRFRYRSNKHQLLLVAKTRTRGF
ncbi:MAG: hypothetical protein ABF240_10635 [Flavobacteriales bacterium]